MKILFHLGHPAHFHLFKNNIKILKENGDTPYILIKKKDVLEDLLKSSGFDYLNILPDGRKDSMVAIGFGLLRQDLAMIRFCLKHKVDLLIGTSASINRVGKFMNIPSLFVGEDDAAAVPLQAKIGYPFLTKIITPTCCDNGKWDKNSIKYEGYHELAYLAPKYFSADKALANKYVNTDEKYFVLRFAKLGAHHDKGIGGINDEMAEKLVDILSGYGRVYITSERVLNASLEKYRVAVDPIDMHHVLAFSTVYIGDSQTMAAEAAVLGVPFIRFNDFVGRIGYLDELENKYHLGFGIKTKDKALLFEKAEALVKEEDVRALYAAKREKMLADKIDVVQFLDGLIAEFAKK